MDPSGYIKLIEFTYILEGFQILYECETDKSVSGEMFSTASAIMDEIYQYSWFRKTLSNRTQSLLSQQWRKVINKEQGLDSNLFQNVLLDINNVCQEYLLKKFTMEKYSSRYHDFKQSSLTIDSGVATLVEQPQSQPGGPKQSEELATTAESQKKDKKSKFDKFAAIPKELLEKSCKPQSNVLEKHINKTFNFLNQSTPSAGPLKHLKAQPTEDDLTLPILQYKLKKFALNKNEN